jgi:hypothetical protein
MARGRIFHRVDRYITPHDFRLDGIEYLTEVGAHFTILTTGLG